MQVKQFINKHNGEGMYAKIKRALYPIADMPAQNGYFIISNGQAEFKNYKEIELIIFK